MDLDADFGLRVVFTEREDSPIGDTTTTTIHVDGRAVSYEGPFGTGEMGVYDTETVRFELTDQQASILRRELDTYDMCQSVTERYDAATADAGDEYAVRREIDVEATLVVDGKQYDVDLEGVTSVDGNRTDREHPDQLRGLRHLCGRFKEWAEESREPPSYPWWHPQSWLS